MTKRRGTTDDALLAFMGFYGAHDGIPPTVRDMMERMGLASTASGHYWLRDLEQHEYIRHAVGPAAPRDYVPTTLGLMRWAALVEKA